MNQEKLAALRAKYEDRPLEEVDDPGFRQVMEMIGVGSLFSGLRTLLDAPHKADMEGLDIALIGVPFDLGVVHRAGARFGPQAIRDITSKVGPYNHYNRINPFALCEIADVGDVPLAGFSLDNGIAQIEAFYRQVHLAGVKPVSAGGDHSVTYPILKAIGLEEPLGLVHVDAHCDTMGAIGDSKFHHGGPFRNAVLDGVVDPERTIQIGIRGTAEAFWEFSYDAGMTVIHMEDFERLGVDAVIAKAREVVGGGPCYVSFDVDGLDPVFAAGTGTPEVGGLTTREAQQLLRGLRGLNIVGGDVVEVAPEYDSTTNTAQTGKQMMFEILCLTADSIAERRG